MRVLGLLVSVPNSIKAIERRHFLKTVSFRKDLASRHRKLSLSQATLRKNPQKLLKSFFVFVKLVHLHRTLPFAILCTLRWIAASEAVRPAITRDELTSFFISRKS